MLRSSLKFANQRLLKMAFERNCSTLDMHKHGRKIFASAVSSVLPREIVHSTLKIENGELLVNNNRYPMKKDVKVVGFGKAVLGMGRAVEEIIGTHLDKMILSVPVGIRERFKDEYSDSFDRNPKILIQEGAKSNIPDENAHKTAKDIFELAKSLKEDDILLVLITGGGSALLPYPVDSLTLDDKAKVSKLLGSRGAKIQELNTVRKHLSVLKGGGLAKAAYPGKVITLILSDVIDDPLDLIASGPTVKDTSTPQDCLDILDILNAATEAPENVMKYLESVIEKSVDDSDFFHVRNFIIGNNRIATKAAEQAAKDLGYIPVTLSHSLEGEADLIGTYLAKLAKNVYSSMTSQNTIPLENKTGIISTEAVQKLNRAVQESKTSSKPLCIICGGESTVQVRGSGIGGRNQHLVLSAALELQDSNDKGIVILSGGTDGIDGPNDAAGAIIDTNAVNTARKQKLNPEVFLDNSDSYTFFKRFNNGDSHVIIGHTGTNVMDIQIILINKSIHSVQQD